MYFWNELYRLFYFPSGLIICSNCRCCSVCSLDCTCSNWCYYSVL